MNSVGVVRFVVKQDGKAPLSFLILSFRFCEKFVFDCDRTYHTANIVQPGHLSKRQAYNQLPFLSTKPRRKASDHYTYDKSSVLRYCLT